MYQNQQNTHKIRRLALLDRLKTNREDHRNVFDQAIVGYRRSAIAELDRSISDAKAGKRIRLSIQLIEPKDHTAEYDTIIDLFTMVEDEFIELSFGDFLRFVRDQWDWTGQFTETASFYNQK